MKKQLFLIILLVGLFDILLFSCGRWGPPCPEVLPFTYFGKISFQHSQTDGETVLADSSLIVQDNYRVLINLGYEYTVFKQTEQRFGGNALYALSCLDEGYEGLRHKITGYSITCDKDMLGIKAGESLEGKLQVVRGGYQYPNETKYTVQEWVDRVQYGGKGGLNRVTWYMEFVEPITSAEYLKFTLHFELEDGSLIEESTGYVRFN
ncbi:MAG: hypothetical protein OEX02_17295 [Cyclobacteriaceae bacterium]|nr:hypothetical protein [Cyclobacteriaceae bacterium]